MDSEAKSPQSLSYEGFRKEAFTRAFAIGVSRSALLYRLKSLGLINSEIYDNYARNVIKSATYNGYPLPV